MASRSGSSPAQCHPPTIPGPWIATRPTSSPSRYRIVIHCQTNSVSVFSTPSLFNAQSVGNSRRHLEICSFISDYDVDTMLLTKMWLCKSGDDAKCRDLTRATSFFLFSLLPLLSGAAASPLSSKTPCATTVSFPFPHTLFERAQVTLSFNKQRISFYCVYRPPPNKTNKMTDLCFFDELPLFLEQRQ